MRCIIPSTLDIESPDNRIIFLSDIDRKILEEKLDSLFYFTVSGKNFNKNDIDYYVDLLLNYDKNITDDYLKKENGGDLPLTFHGAIVNFFNIIFDYKHDRQVLELRKLTEEELKKDVLGLLIYYAIALFSINNKYILFYLDDFVDNLNCVQDKIRFRQLILDNFMKFNLQAIFIFVTNEEIEDIPNTFRASLTKEHPDEDLTFLKLDQLH
jgi:hypothetical protein